MQKFFKICQNPSSQKNTVSLELTEISLSKCNAVFLRLENMLCENVLLIFSTYLGKKPSNSVMVGSGQVRSDQVGPGLLITDIDST